MPNIIIREFEAPQLATFDITENTVLIPMLYARDFNEEIDDYTVSQVESTLFTDADTFSAWARSHSVTVDEFVDRSYIMAYELLLQGMNVVIKPILFDNHTIGASIDEDTAYDILENAINNDGALSEFKDRNLFNIKFITTGGYANCGKTYVKDGGAEASAIAYETIRQLAQSRGDVIALIEFRDYFEDEEDLLNSIQNDYKDSNEGADLFAAAFFPWFTFNTSAVSYSSQQRISMPASFGYLMAYANSVKSNANWFAAAGTIRGLIPGLIKPVFNVGEALMHTLQGDNELGESLKIMVNPIYNAGTYGYRIWGNRVVSKTSIAQDDRYMNFLNVRMLLCDIKKQIFHTAMRCTFEPNDDIVWINFKTLANSLLDRMKSGRGISWYKWTKERADEKATIKATLTIKPVEAVESFDINIILTDEEVEIAETV